MPSSSFIARIDRHEEEKMLRGYSGAAVDHILTQAAKVGAVGAAQVMKAEAPIGTSERLSQYYRRMGLGHGTFRKSVRAAPIRGRGSMISGLQGKTVGQVIGPMGRNAFTRAWIEEGTARGMPATHWVERVAHAALSVAREASDAVLALYVRAH